MHKDPFHHEQPMVAMLLTRLGLEVNKPLANANAAGDETGADVVAIIGDRRVGIQVTEIDNSIALPGVEPKKPHKPGAARGMEKALAAQQPNGSYGGFAENDHGRLLANIIRAVERKALHRVGGFDELWLLLVCGVPENGAVISTFVPTTIITPEDLDRGTSGLLAGSSYDRVFLLPILGLETATYQWDKKSARWSKNIKAERFPPHSLYELLNNQDLLSDPDGWAEREAIKVLREIRGEDAASR